ncbi:MAG: anhydro-N-acetylmuramic acid kinase, partial [Alphaproteobacteria bacterium]|nr:anhydro-N-acetylmuramic acid kinase [Alphaproteobacteria bacterium]
MAKPLTAIGLMSGTSLDGIDAALLVTDGERVDRIGGCATTPYPPALKERLLGVLGGRGEVAAAADAITRAHAESVRLFLQENKLTYQNIDIIGFHGQTILHRPQEGRTWQIGDGRLLAALTGIDVVDDFRSADVAAGGEGAPLAPLYHRALARSLARPLAVLNIGGVANLTWIGAEDRLIAFDTGPGNALVDDWVRTHGRGEMDRDGAIAARGRVDEGRLADMLAHPYFDRPAPKSLDRDDFQALATDGLSLADGAATLTRFTVEAVARALDQVPAAPVRWLVTGGGRHNPTLMAGLGGRLGVGVEPVEAVGWRGDALEAEAFAFLAVRSLRGLALSLPSTTGAEMPVTGGVLHRA